MTKFEQIGKKEADLFLKAIDKYEKPCMNCSKPVTGQNFGIIHADGICCKSILCQSTLIGIIEEEQLCKCQKCGNRHEQERMKEQ